MTHLQSVKRIRCPLCPVRTVFDNQEGFREVLQLVSYYMTDNLLTVFTSTENDATQLLTR